MGSFLDCGSFDLALATVSEILRLAPEELYARLKAFDCAASEGLYDETPPLDLRILHHGLGLDKVPVADTIHWYHAARTWADSTFREGIWPLEQIEPELWRKLGLLASDWSAPQEWRAFQGRITELANSPAFQYRNRRSVPGGGGPYGFLFREAICEQSDEPSHYLDAPETVADICRAYEEETGHPLLDRFREATACFIVTFKSASRFGKEVLSAVEYLYGQIHDPRVDCDWGCCFSGGGIPVPPRDIVRVELITRNRRQLRNQ